MADEPTTTSIAEIESGPLQRMDPDLGDWIVILHERIAELELALDDQGWMPLGQGGQDDFTRQGLARINSLARKMALKDPTIARGVEVQMDYVFGQGVNIRAQDQRVQALVTQFWDDPRNRVSLTSDQSLAASEQTLMVAGNLFLVLFVNPSNGRVRVRQVPFSQIQEIYFNPQDGAEPWYYKRTWTETRYETDQASPIVNEREAWYPDWRFAPDNTPSRLAMSEVLDQPMFHVRLGGFQDMKFGVPVVYRAMDWAKAYKDFLTDWATLTRALSKFAWKATVKGGQDKVSALAASLGRIPTDPTEGVNTNRKGAGGIWTQNEQVDLSAMPKTGANVSSEDGRRLLLMTASAFGIPETFFGDADVGNHATAKTLDRPTELHFRRRQTHWQDVLTDLLQFQVDQSIAAPNGALPGTFEEPADDDPLDQGRWVLEPLPPGPGQEAAEEGDRTIDVTFPPILEPDVAGQVNAVVDAITLKGSSLNDVIITPDQAARLMLEAMGVDDADEWLAEIFPLGPDGKPTLRADQQRREELQAKADAQKLALAGRTPDGAFPPAQDEEGPPTKAAEAFREAVQELVRFVEAKIAS